MLVVRPRLHEFVSAEESRTLKQLEALGIDSHEAPKTPHGTVAIKLDGRAGASRQLLAYALLDYVLRLDPLVDAVHLHGFDEPEVRAMGKRVPIEVDAPEGQPDLAVAIGVAAGDDDLTIDGCGWLSSISTPLVEVEEPITNPIGPRAAAAIGAGEIFKMLFQLNYPDSQYARRFVPAAGTFSFFDYRFDGESPRLEPVVLDATLVGAGGVGAGVIATIGDLNGNVSGVLRIVDADTLSRDNLNRVTYARVQSAIDEVEKVAEAADYLRQRAANLTVSRHPCRFEEYKRQLASRRRDRCYDVVLTGLDDDLVRHEVQRELPRVLIDGATGRDANMIVERVMLGEWGCLGCTRQNNQAPIAGEHCDGFPDERAPSVSFLAALPGILATGELIKEALGGRGSLSGSFEHIFVYGLNGDLVRQAAASPRCRIQCSRESVRATYRTKYLDQS
jgi:hypothetical protein